MFREQNVNRFFEEDLDKRSVCFNINLFKDSSKMPINGPCQKEQRTYATHYLSPNT